MCLCANSTALIMSSSEMFFEDPSIMVTAFLVPATTRSMSLSSDLREGGVHDPLAFQPPDPHRAHRPLERDAGYGQRGGCRVDGKNVMLVLPVSGQDVDDDLDLVDEVARETGA